MFRAGLKKVKVLPGLSFARMHARVMRTRTHLYLKGMA
jgi:hypothetical protein